MSDRIVKIKHFLTTKFPKGTQLFNSRNLVGDYMLTIYKEEGITIDWCEDWDYIEIFGVDSDEYDLLCETIGKNHWNGAYEGN